MTGYKVDRGEEGEQPDSVQNSNVLLFNRMAHEGLSSRQGHDVFVFARNVSDTARGYSAVWNGDSQPTFDGLKYSMMSGLRSGAINFPMWGSDSGGYAGTPTKETFARWLEFSAYSPMMEVLIGRQRSPWYDYDRQLVTIARDQAATHHDLMPYSYSQMYEATRTGVPVMRALLLEYPQDPRAAGVTDEYMYGPGLLVAPVTSQGATSRSVYLPAGRWLDYNDRTTVYSGSRVITARAPLATIPVYVKEGAIIPRGDIHKGDNNWSRNWRRRLRIEIFPSSATSSTFSYYTGTRVVAISSEPKRNTIEIKIGDPEIDGELQVYVHGLTGVTRRGVALAAGRDYVYDLRKKLLTVPFSGATTLSLKGASGIFGR